MVDGLNLYYVIYSFIIVYKFKLEQSLQTQIQTMKQDTIQIVDITGTPFAFYEADSIDSLLGLYKNQLLRITQTGLEHYEKKGSSSSSKIEDSRFVVAKNLQQRQILLNVKPVKCYLRFGNEGNKVININPFQSIRWLKSSIEKEKKQPVVLTVNNVDLTDEGESLLKYIHQNAIINVNILNKQLKIIPFILVKEPGLEAKTHKLQNISVQDNCENLFKRISQLVQIPYQFLHLVYGGKMLLKQKPISDYHIQNNGCISAVDQRKYMKKLSLAQYKKWQTQVKQMKENNKALIKKVKQAIQSQKKQKNSPKKPTQNQKFAYLNEKSGSINQGEDIQYFKQPKMSIESQEYQQFQRMDQQLHHHPKGNPQLNRLNSQLKHGRIITNQKQVYQDEEGLIHEHNKQKSIYRNRQQIVNVDIAEDQQGNVVKIQKDIVNIRRDSTTGEVTKVETDVVEDTDHGKYVLTKQEVRDSEGHLVRFETSRVREDQGELAINDPVKSEHKEVSIDTQGNIRVVQKQIIEDQGKTTFINKDTIQDVEGHVLSVKTNVVEIEGDGQGNIHKHKSQIIEQGDKVTLVQTTQLIDLEGVRIRKQKDTIQIQQQQDGTVVKKETDVIEEQGYTKIIKRGVVEDEYGNVIKSQTKVINIEESQYSINVHEREEVLEEVEAGQDAGDQQIQKQVNVVQDQQGNTITHEKQIIQDEEGQAKVVDRYVVEDSQGNVVRQKTQVVQLDQSTEQPEVYRHIVDYRQEENKVVLVEKLTKQNVDGSIIKSQKETVQIQQLEDGTFRKRQTDIVHEDGRKMVYVRNETQDQVGRLISKTSDIMEVSALGPSNAIMYSDGSAATNFQVQTINRKYDYDQQGNLYVVQKKIKNSQGQQKVTERQYLFDEQGKVILTQTGITKKQQGPEGQLLLTASDIIQEEGKVTVIQSNRMLDSEGNQIRRQSGTMYVQDIGDGITRKEKQTIVEQAGLKVKINKEAYQDQEGNLLQQKCLTTEIGVDDQGNKQITQKYTRKHEQVSQDQEGNFHLKQKQIIDDQQGKIKIIESEVVRDTENNLLKATTDVIQLKEQEQGLIHRHEVNIIEKPGKVTIAQSASVENAQGQKLQGEVKSVIVTQGPNNQIIKQETNIVMQDYQQTIIQKITVEDSEGNVLAQEGKTKNIYIDQQGRQQQRQIEKYEIMPDDGEEEGDRMIERHTIQDERGNVHTIQKEVIETQNENITIESQVVKNAKGELVGMNKNVIKTEQLEQGIVSKQNKQILTDQKVVTSQTVTLANFDGSILSQNQKRVQITEDQGLIRTSKFDIIRQEGRTVVGVVDTLEDQQGNVIDQNQNIIKIRDNQQAVREHARKIAKAEIDGQITAVIKRSVQDNEGNKHYIQKQVIDDHGSRIVVDTETIRSPQGQIIQTITGITQQKLQDGTLQKYQTQIIEDQDGRIKVVEYINRDEQQYQQLPNQQAEQQNMNELLGLEQRQGYNEGQTQGRRIKIKQTQSIDNNELIFETGTGGQESGRKIRFNEDRVVGQQSNLLQTGGNARINEYEYETQTGQYKQLPIYSKKQLSDPVKVPATYYQSGSYGEQGQEDIPESYPIILMDKHRNQTQLIIRYDDIVDEVAKKLAAVTGRPYQSIRFYKDGEQLQEYLMMSQAQVLPNSVLYYIDQ